MKAWSCRTTRGNSVPAARTRERRPVRTLVGAVVLLGALLGAGPAVRAEDAVPPAAQAKPVVGERLGFHGRWFTIPVGYGWIEVKGLETIDGRQAYHIEIQGHTNDVLSKFYPIHDVVHSYLDAETLQPLRFQKDQREGHYRAHEAVTFDPSTKTAHYVSYLNDSEKTIPLPDAFQDLVSAIFWFRAQPLTAGGSLDVQIYTDEKFYDTRLLIRGFTMLELLKRGTFRCVEVEPQAHFKGLLVKRGRIWMYVTADARRLPLLIKATTPWGPMSAVIDASSIGPASDGDGRDAPGRAARP